VVVLIAVIGCAQRPVAPPPPPHERAATVAPDAPPPALPPATMQLAAGGHHTCLLDHEQLWCWGKNDHGQLGDGTRKEQVVPERITTVAHPVAISLGGEHTCVLDAAGGVWCWGQINRDEYGQAADVLRPKHIELPMRAVEIGAAMSHTCARLEQGRVACWGANEREQYLLGGAGADFLIPGLTGVTSLRVGANTSCVLHNGKVLCWGGHWLSGFLGAEHGKFAPTPTEIPELAGATEVAPGAAQVCARFGGTVRCRGVNSDAVLGDPKVKCCGLSTSVVPGLDDAVALSSAFDATCALRATGAITCWGRMPGFPGAWTFDDHATQIAPGYFHGCYANAAHDIKCWGDGGNGQLGNGRSERVASPAKVVKLDDAVELAISYVHSCARRKSGAVACWGPHPAQSEPTDVPGLGPAEHVTSGIYESCAVNDSKVTCTQRSRDYKPGVVKFPGKLRSFAHGAGGICAALVDGKVACVPEIPDAHTIPGDLPERTATIVAGFSGIQRIWSGAFVCGASKTELRCTNQTETGWAPAQPVPGIAGADVAMFAGQHVLMRDGRIGMIGYGNKIEWRDDIHDATAIAEGEGHTCVLRGDRVWCWGANNAGELGDGNREYEGRRTSAIVPDLEGVLEIGAGGDQTCARTKDAVYCWGSNEYGRLGIGAPPTIVREATRVDGLPR